MWTGIARVVPFMASLQLAVAPPADSVSVDFTMAERGLEWLHEVEAGAGTEALRASFRERIAPTRGTRAVVAHWARFREWDAEIFMEFVLAALGRSDPPEQFARFEDEDGELTLLGLARRSWRRALEELPRLERDLAALERGEPGRRALRRARAALPPDAEISARIHVVLFGVSPAFAVGDLVGFDLLQLPRTGDDELDVDAVARTFAHELHHSGFRAYIEEHMGAAAEDPALTLLGAATAEGLATCLVNRPHRASERWARALAEADSLMPVFQEDLRRSLAGRLPREELVRRWFRGDPGPVYVVGVHMCETVKAAAGKEAVVGLVKDFRAFPGRYNESVPDDGSSFRFAPTLVERIERRGS